MEQIKCPICDKRVCDSDKSLKIEKISSENSGSADIVIKCKNCKAHLAVKVIKGNSFVHSTMLNIRA